MFRRQRRCVHDACRLMLSLVIHGGLGSTDRHRLPGLAIRSECVAFRSSVSLASAFGVRGEWGCGLSPLAVVLGRVLC